MEPDQLLVVDAGVSDASVEEPVGGEVATGGTVAGTTAGSEGGVVGGTTAGEVAVGGDVGGTTAGAVGGEVVEISAGSEAGVVAGSVGGEEVVTAGVVGGEVEGDVAQGGEVAEEPVECDESQPETCMCVATEETACEEQEVVASTEQPTKGEDDSCNQIGLSSPILMATLFAAVVMKRTGKIFG